MYCSSMMGCTATRYRKDDSFDVALYEDFDRWANSRLYYIEPLIDIFQQ